MKKRSLLLCALLLLVTMLGVSLAGCSTSTVSLTDLPAGPVTFTATAHPAGDGSGVPQSRGVFAAAIVAGQSVPVTLTMDSTITSVLLTPPSPSVTRGQGLNLAASAQDAGGAVVLTANENWVWESSNPRIAAIGSASGGQAALDARLSGIVTITARETESGRTAQASVTVLGPPVMNADGANVRNISNDLTHHYFYPVWSPDGTKIAFTRSRIFNDNRGRQVVTEGAGILTMNPDGSGLARITMSPTRDAYPSWSR